MTNSKKKTTSSPLDARLVKDLIKRKKEYERYFDGIKAADKELDHKAEHAYANLVKTIIELAREVNDTADSQEDMEEVAKKILETEYGIRR